MLDAEAEEALPWVELPTAASSATVMGRTNIPVEIA